MFKDGPYFQHYQQIRLIILLISFQLFKSTGEEYWCRMYRLWGSEHETSRSAFWLLNENCDFSFLPPYLAVYAESQNLFYITYIMGKLVERCYSWNYSLFLHWLSFAIIWERAGVPGERSTGNLSLYHFIIHNMMINLNNWKHGCHCQIVSIWHFVKDNILFSFAMPTGWLCCNMHVVFLWFTFQVGIGGECLSSASGSLQSISLYFFFSF